MVTVSQTKIDQYYRIKMIMNFFLKTLNDKRKVILIIFILNTTNIINIIRTFLYFLFLTSIFFILFMPIDTDLAVS